MDVAYTARILCKLCNAEVRLSVEGLPDPMTENEIDTEAIRRSIKAGICPVDLPHIETRYPGQRVSIYQRRVWICADCARCIMRVFTIDAGPVIEALPAVEVLPATVRELPERAGEDAHAASGAALAALQFGGAIEANPPEGCTCKGDLTRWCLVHNTRGRLFEPKEE